MSGFGRKGLAGMPDIRQSKSARSSGAIRFDVTPHPWKMLFAAFACLFAILMLLALAVEGRGLILFVIPLGPMGAQIFYVLMAMVCAVGLVHTVRGFVRSFGEKMWMSLDQRAIIGPNRYGGTNTVRIAFSGIIKVDLSSHSDDQYLVITGRDGKKIKVSSANFREPNEWSAFIEALDLRLNASTD